MVWIVSVLLIVITVFLCKIDIYGCKHCVYCFFPGWTWASDVRWWRYKKTFQFEGADSRWEAAERKEEEEDEEIEGKNSTT